MINEIPKLYTEKEAAKVLTIGYSTLQKTRIAGKIGFIRINGKEVRYTPDHLTKYLEKNQRNLQGEK